MLNPQFPYSGSQVIISSDRVLAHSKNDAVFLFGKAGVGISTNATFNVDAIEGTIINSNKIELGLRASTEGEPVLLGKTTLDQITSVLDELIKVGDALSKMTVESFADAVPQIQYTAASMRDVASRAKNILTALS